MAEVWVDDKSKVQSDLVNPVPLVASENRPDFKTSRLTGHGVLEIQLPDPRD